VPGLPPQIQAPALPCKAGRAAGPRTNQSWRPYGSHWDSIAVAPDLQRRCLNLWRSQGSRKISNVQTSAICANWNGKHMPQLSARLNGERYAFRELGDWRTQLARRIKTLAELREWINVTPASFPTLSPTVCSWMLDPLPRRYTVCSRLFLPRCHRPSPKEKWVGFPQLSRLKRLRAGGLSRLQIFRYVPASKFARPPDRPLYVASCTANEHFAEQARRTVSL
jgi:hypothetical protein